MVVVGLAAAVGNPFACQNAAEVLGNLVSATMPYTSMTALRIVPCEHSLPCDAHTAHAFALLMLQCMQRTLCCQNG